jgi:hypothetical protein
VQQRCCTWQRIHETEVEPYIYSEKESSIATDDERAQKISKAKSDKKLKKYRNLRIKEKKLKKKAFKELNNRDYSDDSDDQLPGYCWMIKRRLQERMDRNKIDEEEVKKKSAIREQTYHDDSFEMDLKTELQRKNLTYRGDYYSEDSDSKILFNRASHLFVQYSAIRDEEKTIKKAKFKVENNRDFDSEKDNDYDDRLRFYFWMRKKREQRIIIRRESRKLIRLQRQRISLMKKRQADGTAKYID